MITRLIYYPGKWTSEKLTALESVLQKSIYKTALYRIARLQSTVQCKQFALYLEENKGAFTAKQHLALQIALQYVFLNHCISASSVLGYRELVVFIKNASPVQLSLAVRLIQENIHAFNTNELMRLSSMLTQAKLKFSLLS